MKRGDLSRRARRIRLLILDVDGVLTDGRIILDSRGGQSKHFDVKDGFGLVLVRQAGLKVALITAERSAVVAFRSKQLHLDWVAQYARDKEKAFRRCLAHFRMKPEEAAYLGDDLLDLPVLLRVGLAGTVADAHPEVKRRAHVITRRAGGHGAVREFIDGLLRAQGKWPKILERYVG